MVKGRLSKQRVGYTRPLNIATFPLLVQIGTVGFCLGLNYIITETELGVRSFGKIPKSLYDIVR